MKLSSLLFVAAVAVASAPIVAALAFIAIADFSAALVSILSAFPMIYPAMLLIEASVDAEFKGR